MRPVSLLILLGAFLFQCNDAFALDKKDSLILKLNSTIEDTVRIKTLLELHKVYRFNTDSSLYYLRQATALAENIKDNNFIARTQVAFAWHYITTTKKQDSALYIARTLLERMQKVRYLDGMAKACNTITVVYAETQLDSAVYYALKTIELHQKNNNINGVNSVKINLGGIYHNMKKYDEAIAVAKEVLPYFEEIKNYHYAGTVCINLGNYYLSLQNFDSAVVYMQKSYAYNKLRGDAYGEAYALAQIGNVYLEQNKFNEALPFFKQAVSGGKQINSDEVKYMGVAGLIKIAAHNNNWDEVLVYDTEELDSAALNEADELSVFEMLSKAHEAKGNFAKSLNYYKKYILLRSRTENNERLQKADELEAIYQNKEKQNKIELLNKEKEIEAAEKNKQLLIRNGIIVLSLVLIALGALLFNRFKLNKKIEQQQALLNERKRISTELHDDLGAQLSTTRMLIGNLKSKNETKDDAVIIEKSIGMLEDSIYKLRTIMSDLENTTLEKDGYLKATEELINKISSLQDIKFNLSHTGLDERLNKNTEHHLFRITQELVNNTLKYANAKKISVDIVRNNNCVTFLYEDDGAGFDTGYATTGKGLRNIAHRAGSLNAQMELDSSPGNGMRLNLQFNII